MKANNSQSTHPVHRVTNVVTVAIMLALTTPLWGQTTQPQSGIPSTTGRDCQRCHSCEKPTHEMPCLIPCSRDRDERFHKQLAKRHGPDMVILDELEDRYLPVPFDHKGHAEMAAMTRGCVTCHHYTPEGAEHPACVTCHEVSPRRIDISKPGLKGAYHRQCMSCHRDWSGETRCVLCHAPKTSTEVGANARMPATDDLIGRMHPPIPEPDKEIYRIEREGYPTGYAIFRHQAHIHRYGLKCAECHHEDNCNRCHEQGKQHVQRTRTLAEHHRPCIGCHAAEQFDPQANKCDTCHYENGESPPPPFTHEQTGWPLNRYHKPLSCRACHESVPFTRLNSDCNTCHGNWSIDTFDHAVTGQALDEIHVEIECQFCHTDRNFTLTPTCEECHDKENVSFPTRRPGPLRDQG